MSRPFCKSPQCANSKVCQLETGSLFSGGRCISEKLERRGSIHVSPICHDTEMPAKNSAGHSNSDVDCTSMAVTTVVSSVVVPPSETPNFASTLQRPADIPITRIPSTVQSDQVQVSCMETLRRQDIDQGVSKDAAKLLSDFSWRGGTTRAYNSNWGQWTSWCSDRQIDPFRSSVVEVVNNLTERFHSGDSYRSLNSRRSAISAFHITIEGEKVGQHPLVSKLLKALFNARPPQPRYAIQWDVDQVLQYIKSLGPNSTLSDKDLSFKVAMLLALASAGRSSELNALDLRYMADKEDVITFTLGKPTKSRKFGSAPLSVSFHALKEDPTLCVVQTIRAYVQRSNLWRKRNVLSKNQLLLSYIEPHKPVVSCTIAGWLIKTLKSAGINTEEFKAHSIRGAVTSKAQAKGLSCKEIMEVANWSKATTFKRHYLRAITKKSSHANFQQTVLS